MMLHDEVESGGDDCDEHFAMESVVDDSTEDDVGFVGHIAVDDVGGFLHFVQGEVRTAGDREDNVSSNGLLIALRAASTARPSPVARPTPIKAEPAVCMIAFTSAKSTLIKPGTVMMSEIACTPCISTLSASTNASCIDAR
jgi:hypothetical protein